MYLNQSLELDNASLIKAAFTLDLSIKSSKKSGSIFFYDSIETAFEPKSS